MTTTLPSLGSVFVPIKIMALIVVAGLVFSPAPGSASAPETPAAQALDTTGPTPVEATALIRDLMAGKLAPDVDPHALFQTSFASRDTPRAKFLLTLLNNPALLARARKSADVLPGLTPDLAALTVAQAEFLTLPKARRTALLEIHHRRAEQAMAANRLNAEKTATLNRLTRRADGLQAFLDGKPADPDSLKMDMLDPAEAALSKSRRAALLAPTATGEQNNTGTPSIDARIAAEIARIDQLRAQILALPADRRAQLIARAAAPSIDQATATAAKAAAEEASEAAAAAALAAERARNETERLIEGERSKLMATRQKQAQFELALAQREDVTGKVQEIALGWRRKVRELQARSPLDPAKKTDADRLYFQLVDALRTIRSELGMALGSSAADRILNLDPPRLDESILREPAAAAPLEKLRQQLLDNAIRLRGLDDSIRWNERTALMNAMVEMNEIRLSLIDDLSANMRSQIVGFGEAGVAQAGREMNQIMLALRYNFLYLPQNLDGLMYPFLHPTPRLVFGFIQLILLVLIFRYWRQYGDTILAGIAQRSRTRRPQTVASTALAAGILYFRQTRRPFDWLVLLLLLRWLLPPEMEIAGADYIWMIAFWLLAAAFLVRLSDALAQGNRRNDPHAILRQRSLRLVAGVIIVVGLILSLTSKTVGIGAIYHWVFNACWLLVIPVALLLTAWWRDEITALAASGAQASPVLAWCVRNQDGVAGHFTRVVAGSALLLEGARGVLIRRANDVALIREIATQRARARAAARVAADEASGRFRPLTPSLVAALDPHHEPASRSTGSRSRANRALPELAPAGLVVVTGERGLGKTTTLDDLVYGSRAAEHIRIGIREGGYHSVLADLGQAVGSAASEAEILAAFQKRPYTIVTIDDVQRLIVPAIGGLTDFDRLISLARAPGEAASWAISIGGPAWSYLSRARSGQSIFDQIIALPRWEMTELRGLIERRTGQAGLEPEFDQLEHTGRLSFDSDITPGERIKRAYFAGLDEYCEGNPAVALEFWRRSLFEDTATGRITVRTFATPSAQSLLALPQTTIFMLRAILQMEIATPETVQRGTDLPQALVTDALRSLTRGGIIRPREHGYRITLFWYREMIRLLERQNLLVRSAA